MTDTAADYTHAIGMMRLAFVTERQWNHEAGRLETAVEWLDREQGRTNLRRPATPEDVLKVIEDMRENQS